MAANVIFIRHGVLADAFQGRYIGRTDPPLSPAGRRQAEALAARLRGWGEAEVIVSPLSRCRETATLALGRKGSFTVDPDLREIDFGRWEGMTFAQISALDPEAADRWAALEEDFAFPKGEGIAPFKKRIASVATRIAANPRDTVVAVTHGGVIRFLLCHFLGLGAQDYLLYAIDPASISELRIAGNRSVLTRLNDRRHLEGP